MLHDRLGLAGRVPLHVVLQQLLGRAMDNTSANQNIGYNIRTNIETPPSCWAGLTNTTANQNTAYNVTDQ